MAIMPYMMTHVLRTHVGIMLYHSPNIVSVRLRWAGHVGRIKEGRSAVKILTRKPTGKKPLSVPGRILEWLLKEWYLYEELYNPTQDRDFWRA